MFLRLSGADTRSHKADTKSAHRIGAAVRRISGKDATRMENGAGELHFVGAVPIGRCTACIASGPRGRSRLPSAPTWIRRPASSKAPAARATSPARATSSCASRCQGTWKTGTAGASDQGPRTPSATFGAGWRPQGLFSSRAWQLSDVAVRARDDPMDKQTSANDRIRPRAASPLRQLKPHPPPATPSPASTAAATPPATPASPPPAPPSLRRRPRRRWPRGVRAW